jgi:hypothetical protein
MRASRRPCIGSSRRRGQTHCGGWPAVTPAAISTAGDVQWCGKQSPDDLRRRRNGVSPAIFVSCFTEVKRIPDTSTKRLLNALIYSSEAWLRLLSDHYNRQGQASTDPGPVTRHGHRYCPPFVDNPRAIASDICSPACLTGFSAKCAYLCVVDPTQG